MPMTSLAQAIRNAVEAEHAAARFYQRLLANTEDASARQFLERLVREEIDHARQIDERGRELAGTDLPAAGNRLSELVETAPGWEHVEDVSLAEALQVALEAEHQACLYYSAVADAFEGRDAEFFESLSRVEAEHAERIRKLLERPERERA
jgi:rubrerythrin